MCRLLPSGRTSDQAATRFETHVDMTCRDCTQKISTESIPFRTEPNKLYLTPQLQDSAKRMFLGCVDFIPGCCVTKKHYLLEDLSCPPLHHARVCQGAGKIDVELHSSSFYCHNLAEAKTREGRKEELAGSNIQGLRVTEQATRTLHGRAKMSFPFERDLQNFYV